MVHRQAPVHLRFARVIVAEERLQSVSAELHRSPEQHRDRGHRHLVRIGGKLHPERAADVGRHHANVGERQLELRGEHVTHLKRHLVRVMHGELAQARIEFGQNGARLERHPGLPIEAEVVLDYDRGRRGTPHRDRRP